MTQFRAHRSWLALVGVVAVIVIAGSGLLNPRLSVLVDDIAQLVGGFTATAVCWWTGRQRVGVERRWRFLMAAGMAGWSIGMIFWALNRSVLDEPLPSPSIADIGFFMFPVFAVPALLSLVRELPRREAIGRVHLSIVLTLDGLVAVGALFILTWSTALGAVAHTGDSDTVGFLVALMYPVTDFVLIAMVLLMIIGPRTLTQARQPLMFLGGGLVMLALSDSIYTYLVAVGAETMPTVADAGFIAGPPLIALAALASSGERTVGPTKMLWPSSRTQLLLPYVLIAVTAAIVTVQVLIGSGLDPVVFLLGIMVLVLAVVRQILTLLENEALLERISAAQDELRYQARHDPLTALANRAAFDEHVADAIDDHRRSRSDWALLLVDLDNFKQVNDQFGHMVGDGLLVVLAGRLRAVVPRWAVVARFGGDEFTVLVQARLADAVEVAESVVEELGREHTVQDNLVKVGASVGVAHFAMVDEPISAHALLRHADAAMYQAKRSGKGSVVVYDESRR
ncbi:diguanylate cyclase (GGDEF)-like protein [Rhodococcus sp. 27YEA15]|uniref:diguanylate cyclase n=1 Tax=Rhodococcus sp. 27YEA15 TaxID=3156259 RepID=UPI003C7BB9A1